MVAAVKTPSTSRRFCLASSGGLPQPNRQARAAVMSGKARRLLGTRGGMSEILNDFTAVSATEIPPDGEADGFADEPHGTVPQEDVGPSDVLGVHLVGVPTRPVGR